MSTLTDREKADGEVALARKDFDILQEVIAERLRQNRKFCKDSPIGVQHHNIFTWMSILAEEQGEAHQATLDWWFSMKRHIQAPDQHSHLREELIQVAAVAFAIIERLDANDPALISEEGHYVNTLRP